MFDPFHVHYTAEPLTGWSQEQYLYFIMLWGVSRFFSLNGLRFNCILSDTISSYVEDPRDSRSPDPLLHLEGEEATYQILYTTSCVGIDFGRKPVDKFAFQ